MSPAAERLRALLAAAHIDEAAASEAYDAAMEELTATADSPSHARWEAARTKVGNCRAAEHAARARRNALKEALAIVEGKS